MKKHHLGFSRPVSKKSRRKGFGSGPFQRGEPFVFISIPVCGMQIECSLPLAYASGKLALPPTEGGQLIRGAESLQFLGLLLI